MVVVVCGLVYRAVAGTTPGLMLSTLDVPSPAGCKQEPVTGVNGCGVTTVMCRYAVFTFTLARL